MIEIELSIEDKWWSHLRVDWKSHIASKICKRPVGYPECTQVWGTLSDADKADIYRHCIEHHNFYLAPYKEGNCFT